MAEKCHNPIKRVKLKLSLPVYIDSIYPNATKNIQISKHKGKKNLLFTCSFFRYRWNDTCRSLVK